MLCLAGTSFFVKSTNPDKNIKINHVNVKTSHGNSFGQGLDKYVNLYIDSTLF